MDEHDEDITHFLHIFHQICSAYWILKDKYSNKAEPCYFCAAFFFSVRQKFSECLTAVQLHLKRFCETGCLKYRDFIFEGSHGNASPLENRWSVVCRTKTPKFRILSVFPSRINPENRGLRLHSFMRIFHQIYSV